MTLLPGVRFTVAARFALEANWAERLRIGAGVEGAGEVFFPRGPWTAPTAADLALLVAAPREAVSLSLPILGAEPTLAPSDDPDAVTLFQLAGHLRSAWWDMLDEAAAADGPLRGFDGFASRVVQFLNFKQLGAPARSQLEVIVTGAGERSIQRAPDTGAPAGLGPTSAGTDGPRLWGIVNLGDEDTAVVVVNLSFAALTAELAGREPNEPSPATTGELTARFLRAFPDYPLVRVRLAPGEGCRLPAGGLVLDGDPSAKSDPDTLLLISEGSAPPHG